MTLPLKSRDVDRPKPTKKTRATLKWTKPLLTAVVVVVVVRGGRAAAFDLVVVGGEAVIMMIALLGLN